MRMDSFPFILASLFLFLLAIQYCIENTVGHSFSRRGDNCREFLAHFKFIGVHSPDSAIFSCFFLLQTIYGWLVYLYQAATSLV